MVGVRLSPSFRAEGNKAAGCFEFVQRDGRRECGALLRRRERIDVDSAPRTIETDVAVYQRKNSVIAAKTHVPAGQKLCSPLPNNNIAGDDHFAAELFHAEPFANAVAAVLDAALSFFMSHSRG